MLSVVTLYCAEEKPVLAVLDVAVKGMDKSASDVVYGYVMDKIKRAGSYSIVERKELDTILKEMELSLSGIVDEKTAVQIGKISGAEYILLSSLSLEQGVYYLSMRVVSVETGKVIKTSVKKTGLFANLENLTGEAVAYLLDLNALYGEGFVISRSFISTDASLGASFPVGDASSYWGIGLYPVLSCAYNLAYDWGIVGFGVIAGSEYISSNPSLAYRFTTFACPLAVFTKYETNFNTPFFGFAQGCVGVSLLLVSYTGDDNVSAFSIGSSGTLAVIHGSPFSSGAGPRGIVSIPR
jgi:hypothetical protein